jgi:hypothetical protein
MSPTAPPPEISGGKTSRGAQFSVSRGTEILLEGLLDEIENVSGRSFREQRGRDGTIGAGEDGIQVGGFLERRFRKFRKKSHGPG